MKKCPYCKSEEGYVSYSDYIKVPEYHSFDGCLVNNAEMFDNAKHIKLHRDVFCSSCGEKIGTWKQLQGGLNNGKCRR